MIDKVNKELTDKELLDYLDSLPLPAGFGWSLRKSLTDRGYRLHMTTQQELQHLGLKTEVKSNVRDAIKHFIENRKEWE